MRHQGLVTDFLVSVLLASNVGSAAAQTTSAKTGGQNEYG
jgi:hypothetical protein